VEGYYDETLRGLPGWQYSDPVGLGESVPPRNGSDLYLTIDRAAQYIVEQEIQAAVMNSGALSGTVVVLQPDTGAVLAMASYPAYDPNQFDRVDTTLYTDPAVSIIYEPGSVFKVVTIAAALDSGVITPQTILVDNGAIEVGGNVIYNADRMAYGEVNITQVLAKSLNVEAAQIAVGMGWERFYTYVRRFGFGSLTEIDIQGEIRGRVKSPDDVGWYESDLGTNSFGQGIAVTPLQMATAVGAIANDGLMMRPYVVQHIKNADGEITTQPKELRRVVSVETAQAVTAMLTTAVEEEMSKARVPGYAVAGKSGTAQIPVTGGYHPTATIASYAGYLPADDPAFVILVVINRPQTSEWGGMVAAPAFSNIAQRLVVLYDIPPDAKRHQILVQEASQLGQ
jgi:cell division protein FtsI/penicillin-binding protein 2